MTAPSRFLSNAPSRAVSLGMPERAGDWELAKYLAKGGDSIVYVGRQGGAEAAVKVSKTAYEPEVAANPELLAELRTQLEMVDVLPVDLQREADVLRRLQASPNVVDVFEHGVTPDLRTYL